MAVIQELIRVEDNGTLSFGNYLMDSKKKVLDFEADGNLYKVKTFKEITKLEKNGKLLIEIVPGATVHNFCMDDRKVSFQIEGQEDLQITMELIADSEYRFMLDDVHVGKMKTNLAGKLNFSIENNGREQNIVIEKVN